MKKDRKPVEKVPRYRKGSERARILSGIDYVLKSGGGSLKNNLKIRKIK